MHDHRRLGRQLGLFDTDPLIGAGLPYWLPGGAAVRWALEQYVRDLERRAGYQHVYSPVLGKRELYEVSGHWEHYRDAMYPPMRMGGEEVVLRPSLCPHHALIFRSRRRSHRELPLRMAELGGMFRAEPSGSVGGLARVRAINLNDAHLFCAPQQVQAEVAGVLGMIQQAYAALGLPVARYRLSLPEDPHLFVGSQRRLARVLDELGLEFEAERGEAAFYGPKIDVQVSDGAGREFTMSTVQVDEVQPERFDLSYVAPGGAAERPVMVHRAVIGSLERAVALLVDRHGGALPGWLAPVQVVVLPVGDGQAAAAHAFERACLAAGLRVEVAGAERGSLGARVREARLVPVVAVIGPAEAAAGEVSLRGHDAPFPAAAAVGRVARAVAVPSRDS